MLKNKDNNILWSFYEANPKTKVGICKICNRSLSYKSTSNNLKSHLKRQHTEVYNNFFQRSSSPEYVDVAVSSEETDNVLGTTQILLHEGSDIWDIFQKIKNTKIGVCNICNEQLLYNSTTNNLKRHLKSKHHEVYDFITKKSFSSPQIVEFVEENSLDGENSDQKINLRKTRDGSISNRSLSPTANDSAGDNSEGESSETKIREMHNNLITKIPLSTSQVPLRGISERANIKEETNSETPEDFISKRLPSLSNNVSVEDSTEEENSKEEDHLLSLSVVSRTLRSDIWKFFQGNRLTKEASCNLCRKAISYKSTTSNLKQHLRIKHPEEYNDLILKRCSSPSQSVSNEDSSEDQDLQIHSSLGNVSRNLRSSIWEFFDADQSTKLAVCNFCQNALSYKSTISNLKHHLKIKHHKAYELLVTRRSASFSQNLSLEQNSKGKNSEQNEILQLSKDSSKNTRRILWKFFKGNQFTKLASCTLCHKTISFKSSTASLKEHLLDKHYKEYKKLYSISSTFIQDDSEGDSSGADNSLQSINEIQQRETYDFISKSFKKERQDKKFNGSKIFKRSKSDIWNHFKENHITKIAQCNICNKKLSYKSTTASLKQHLKKLHGEAYKDILRSTSPSQDFYAIYISAGEQDETEEFLNDDNSEALNIKNNDVNKLHSDSHQDPFDSGEFAIVEPPKKMQKISIVNEIRPDKKKIIDRCLLKLITEDFQPFSIVEDTGFKEFVSALNPNYQLPNRKTLSTNLLNEEHSNRLAKYSKITQRCESISLTLDCWTCRNMQSFMAVTGHFIDHNTFEFCSVLIQCAALHGQHTAERIVSELRQVASMWNIENKVNLIVSDNASNMVSATKILDWPHFGCYARKFNLVVQGALNSVAIANIVTKVQKVVAYFKRSCEAKKVLLEYQVTTQQLLQPKSLLLSVPTRWISVYKMLERFLEVQEALRATIPDNDADIPIITVDEWQCVDQMVEVLKPFMEVASIMCAENYLIASKAVVLTTGLLTVLTDLVGREFNEPVKNFITKLKNGLFNNFGDIEKNKEVSLCTLLDPRFKQHAFEDETSMLSAKQYILDKIEQINKYNDSNEVAPTPPTASSPSDPNTSLWGRFDTKVASSYQPEITQTKTIDELNMYMNENVIPRTECPLKWWKDRKMLYPNLSKIFIACSNIVVTSLPCDRAFSKTGDMLSDRRTRLTTSKIGKIMFLNANK